MEDLFNPNSSIGSRLNNRDPPPHTFWSKYYKKTCYPKAREEDLYYHFDENYEFEDKGILFFEEK